MKSIEIEPLCYSLPRLDNTIQYNTIQHNTIGAKSSVLYCDRPVGNLCRRRRQKSHRSSTRRDARNLKFSRPQLQLANSEKAFFLSRNLMARGARERASRLLRAVASRLDSTRYHFLSQRDVRVHNISWRIAFGLRIMEALRVAWNPNWPSRLKYRRAGLRRPRPRRIAPQVEWISFCCRWAEIVEAEDHVVGAEADAEAEVVVVILVARTQSRRRAAILRHSVAAVQHRCDERCRWFEKRGATRREAARVLFLPSASDRASPCVVESISSRPLKYI